VALEIQNSLKFTVTSEKSRKRNEKHHEAYSSFLEMQRKGSLSLPSLIPV